MKRINHNNKIQKPKRTAQLMMTLFAFVSILTTFGIVATLIVDSLHFFKSVSLADFFGTTLSPLGNHPSFGVVPLIVGTLLTTLIAILVAVPIGLSSAIYMSEFASKHVRKIAKPVMELLAAIPTIVYGFFAYSVVTPLLRHIIPNLGAKNMLSPGIVMGIMIIPMVASLSEDAMSAVPQSLRDGAYGMGSTKLETSLRVIVPASASGIVASIVLAFSRAIGETMIVVIAGGSSKALTFDITKSLQTMTSYIVEFTSGDAGAGTTGYYSLYAVGLLLFLFTLAMNAVAHKVSKRQRL